MHDAPNVKKNTENMSLEHDRNLYPTLKGDDETINSLVVRDSIMALLDALLSDQNGLDSDLKRKIARLRSKAEVELRDL